MFTLHSPRQLMSKRYYSPFTLRVLLLSTRTPASTAPAAPALAAPL